MRVKVLIAINSDLYYRNFITTDVFQPRGDSCELLLATAGNMTHARCSKEYLKPVAVLSFKSVRQSWRIALMYVSMWAYRRRSKTFSLKFNVDIGPKQKVLYRFLALPGIRHLFFWLTEMILGTDHDIDRLLETLKLDVIVIPSQGNDSLAVDYIKSARKKGIPTFMIVSGWDNLSSKGKILIPPDLIGVWSAQNKTHAIEIHGIAQERIRILGVPHFEKYFSTDHFNEKEFRVQAGLPLNKDVILLAGCSREVNEIELLDILEDAIDKGLLPDMHVLYRPHPWRNTPQDEVSFFDRNYRHATLDPQLAETYRQVKEKRISPHPENTLPELDYYPKLLKTVKAVISPLSTILIEAALNHRPALAIAFSSGNYVFPLEAIYQCTHFRYLDHCKGLLVCHKKENFLDDCRRLVELSKSEKTRQLLEEDMKDIVFKDHRSYHQRLFDEIAAVLGEQTHEPAAAH